MTNPNTRRVYEAPLARDLSAVGVDGQEPLGSCEDGLFPYTGCTAGEIVGEPACTPVGLEVGKYPQCRTGSRASSACLTGGAAG